MDESITEARETKLRGNWLYAKREFNEAKTLYTKAIEILTPFCSAPPSRIIQTIPTPQQQQQQQQTSTTTTSPPTAEQANEQPKERKEDEEEKAELGESEKELVILFSNRAACCLNLQEYIEAMEDCSKALEYDPKHTKSLWRRADAREALGKYREALEDLRKLEKADQEIGKSEAVMKMISRLEPLAKKQQEAEMAEMLGKLKQLGNSILGRFGLSTDNFKLNKDPSTGGYNIRFEQNQQQHQSHS